MRYKMLFVLVASALAVLPGNAQAQDDKKVHVNLGGGFTVPNSEVKDHLGNGYNFNFGVDVAVTPVLSASKVSTASTVSARSSCRSTCIRRRIPAAGSRRTSSPT